jgi:hypothetical protein
MHRFGTVNTAPVRRGNAACSSGLGSRPDCREPRARYRALPQDRQQAGGCAGTKAGEVQRQRVKPPVKVWSAENFGGGMPTALALREAAIRLGSWLLGEAESLLRAALSPAQNDDITATDAAHVRQLLRAS